MSSDRPSHFDKAIDQECLYYSKLVKELVPSLISGQEIATTWITHLLSPDYDTNNLRVKRNQYLCLLCNIMLNGKLDYPFDQDPDNSELPNINDLLNNSSKSRLIYQSIDCWSEIKKYTPDESQYSTPCSIHPDQNQCPRDDENPTFKTIGNIFDEQFKFYLFDARSHANLLPRSSDRHKVVKWLQALCAIDEKCCTLSKGIRNDYMMALTGYLANNYLSGPFRDLPTLPLLPLETATEQIANENFVTDPGRTSIDNFISEMPIVDEGAFAVITLKGDICEFETG